ncbi:MAG: hypothetical protein HY854_01320 [Burkholderiales bacterium]|nr:hypothetical protein [Burkholderiales bacterium]
MKRAGNTIPAQGEKQQRSLRTPNERDESADSQERREPSQRRIGGLAHDAIERGQQDTDKGPVLDATYHKLRK